MLVQAIRVTPSFISVEKGRRKEEGIIVFPVGRTFKIRILKDILHFGELTTRKEANRDYDLVAYQETKEEEGKTQKKATRLATVWREEKVSPDAESFLSVSLSQSSTTFLSLSPFQNHVRKKGNHL